MKNIVILTGAGISKESGIETFRENSGTWEKFNVDDVATFDGWKRNPEMVLKFYNKREAHMSEEYLIQLKGKASLGRPLQISKNYTIAAKFDITSEQKKDRQDGTYAIIYTGEPTGEIAVQNENGDTISLKPKSSVSKTMRSLIWRHWKDSNSELSEDEFYKRVGQIIMDDLPAIIERNKEALK